MSVMHLVVNPWMYCTVCGDGVTGYDEGRNLPCGHFAPAESVCPTWTIESDCQCDIEAAEALQEALEESDRAALTERRQYAERLIETAERWRPTMWWWVVFAVMVALLAGAATTLGTDW